MKTSGAKPAQLAAMVVFAFSCFGLLLFLWLSFGGPIPLKPQGYRVNIAFDEATTLAQEADVRIAGVSVGRVASLKRDPRGNRTLAEIELDRAYAPLKKDAKAILRQKTLLGETYVEITYGGQDAEPIPEGGRLDNSQVESTVELDEVLEIMEGETRQDFRRWQANSADVIEGRGQDLNWALGSLDGFAEDGADLLEILNRRREALGSLVSETGVVFEALTRDEDQLRALISDTAQWFQATASERENLADAIQIMPTFLRESRQTVRRIERFAVDTKPLVDDLGPVAEDLQPTLVDLRRLSPDLQLMFNALPALITSSRDGLPALSRVLRGLEPVLDATGPFLQQINPILQWLQYAQPMVSNFVSVPGWALKGVRPTRQPNSGGHVLPQLITTGSQSILWPTRSPDNRGNAYLVPDAYAFERYQEGYFIFPNWDCTNAGGEKKATQGPLGLTDSPGCFVQRPITFQDETRRFPHLEESMPRQNPGEG